jgi:flagellar biosynthesis/type III secretory pathway chaperone
MREDLSKLDRLDAQALFLGRTGVKTIEELTDYKSSVTAQIETLPAERTALRNEMRRLQRQNAYSAANEIKAKMTGVSRQITQLRKEINLCEGIEERSGRIVRELDEIEKAQEIEGRENQDNELLRRRGRTSR